MIAVFVAETNRVIKIGIRAALQEADGFVIVGEAEDARHFIATAGTAGADVALVDMGLLRAMGTAALAAFCAAHPRIQLLAYSHTRHAPHDMELHKYCISGYLNRGCSPAELRIAIATVAAGRPYINAPFARVLAQEVFRADKLSDVSLTTREMQVFRMLAIGIDTGGIAAQLGLSAKAVGLLKLRIVEKIDGPGLNALTRFAVTRGFI